MEIDPDQPDSHREAGSSPSQQSDKPSVNGATKGHAHPGAGAFSMYARLLRRNGYSSLPIEPGGKRPLAAIGDWNRLRVTPLTDEEIDEIVKRHPYAGLGVAGGYRGLVPIDIDTEEPDIQAAIDNVLPEYLVGKRGRRGATVFYRDPKGIIKPRKFKKADGSMIMEILTTGQAVIPPTVHPETRRPYQWLTDHTLLQVNIDELPELY